MSGKIDMYAGNSTRCGDAGSWHVRSARKGAEISPPHDIPSNPNPEHKTLNAKHSSFNPEPRKEELKPKPLIRPKLKLLTSPKLKTLTKPKPNSLTNPKPKPPTPGSGRQPGLGRGHQHGLWRAVLPFWGSRFSGFAFRV